MQSHIWGGASQYMRKCANFSLYMRKLLVIYDFAPDPSEFPYIWRKFHFLFHQCTHAVQSGLLGVIRAPQLDINIWNTSPPPPSQHLPTNNRRSDGPGRSWCLLSITGLVTLGWAKRHGTPSEASATKRVTACYMPGQASWNVPGQTSMYVGQW